LNKKTKIVIKELNKNILKLKHIRDEIASKHIFKCIDQIVSYRKKKYTLPKCTSVEMGWDDWTKLDDAIRILHTLDTRGVK
jgi:hypothetical protein